MTFPVVPSFLFLSLLDCNRIRSCLASSPSSSNAWIFPRAFFFSSYVSADDTGNCVVVDVDERIGRVLATRVVEKAWHVGNIMSLSNLPLSSVIAIQTVIRSNSVVLEEEKEKMNEGTLDTGHDNDDDEGDEGEDWCFLPTTLLVVVVVVVVANGIEHLSSHHNSAASLAFASSCRG